jgi:hypothetical protein|tara:strand:- start:1695 stop:1901 length:207 start_codon:yes stop_codon:yes gene_type:complete
MNTTGNQAEKKPEFEINKGVELMLRNRKPKKRREPKSFQFIFGQMVSFFKREIHIYIELSLDIKRKPP